MNTLMRRVALGLALPLAVGAPVVLLAGPATADVTPTIDLTSSATPSVYGQEVRITAHAWHGEANNPVTGGSIEFSVDGMEQGPPVHLDATGHAVSPPLVDEGGLPLEVTEVSAFHSVTVQFIADPASGYTSDPMAGFLTQYVDRSKTSIAVQSTATTLVADMTGELPGGQQAGSAKPSGAVQFKVNGAVVGSNDIVAGKATLGYALPPGTQTVTATYTGDDRYLPATQTSSRTDPLLSARVLATFPKSKAGWYRTPVEVFFLCRPQGSEVDDCPADVTLRKSGKDQSLTRTVHALDGGTATVTVSNLDIDREKPRITVDGRSCTATDKLSGVKGGCHLHVDEDGHYRAVAIDRAGNRAVKQGVLD